MPNTGAKPIVIAVSGGIFLYSGIKGISLSTTLRDLLTGRNPSKDAPGLSAQESSDNAPSSRIHQGKYFPSSTTGERTRNRSIGKLLAAGMGWTGKQWEALDYLWGVRESGWNNRAKNPSSGAYGIAQALPADKYPAAGQESGGSDAHTQILWGLRYIKQRYGSPEAAVQHENEFGWY